MNIGEIASHAQVAEESGFSHLTFVDAPRKARDVYSMMTVAALSTRRIMLGQGVTNPYTFHPSVTANATATIDELSNGRAFVGIGTGFVAVRPKGPNIHLMRDLRESVQFIRKYMSGEVVCWHGVAMQSEWIRRAVPIYVSSHGPISLQLAGEVSDGVIFPCGPTEVIKWQVEQVKKGALIVGKDPSKISFWVRTLVLATESSTEARQEVATYAASGARDRYALFKKETPEILDLLNRLEKTEPGLIEEMRQMYLVFDECKRMGVKRPPPESVTQRIVECFHLVGTPEKICQRIRELGNLGVNNISVVLGAVADKKDMMRKIGNLLIPIFCN